MPRRLFAVLIAVSTVSALTTSAAPPATLPATEPSDRAALESEYAALPRHAPVKVGDALAVVMKDDFLAVRARLPATDDKFAVDITDWPGFASCEFRLDGTWFTLNHFALSDHDAVEVNTFVTLRPDYLQVARATETPDRLRSVTLIQLRPNSDEAAETVSLTVQDHGKDAGAPGPADLKLKASTFAELLRQYPAEVRDGLGPVFRDLGVAGVLRQNDPVVAWQVLGPAIEPDAELVKRLDAALAGLDADDFARRATAEDALVALGPPAAAALRRRDLTTLSPDARAAAENVITRNAPLPVERAADLGAQVPFLLDTMLIEEPQLAAAAAARLRALTKRPIDLPATLPPAERERRVEALRAILAATPRTTAETHRGEP